MDSKEFATQPCPNCGYCPTCGRGGFQTLPYPVYPTYPFTPPVGPTWWYVPTVPTTVIVR
jgi:hypothetical protein